MSTPSSANWRVMRSLRSLNLFEHVIAEGTANGEFALGDPRTRAVCIVASIEGALMLSNLHKDRSYMHAVADDLIASVKRAQS